jgi:hypothetical protein
MKTRKNNTMKRAMNKRVLTLAMAMLLAAPAAMAQIFLDDESLTNRGWLGDMDELGNIIPFHEVEWDQANYAPTGGGILLLTVLGGAYLLGKRRKED